MSVNRILLTAILVLGVLGVLPAYTAPIQINLEVVADGLTAPVFLTHAGDGSG